MKKWIVLLGLLCILLPGCAYAEPPAQIAATTLPVYEFTNHLCQGTELRVTRLVTEAVSCLHDYSLSVPQVKAAEAAETVVISGAGLEEFMEGILEDDKTIDSSAGIRLLSCEHAHEHEREHGHEHHHEEDSHIWLSVENAKIMAKNICVGLSRRYPQYVDIFADNLATLTEELNILQAYANRQLSQLSCREMITFHDGFAYFADGTGLTILEAIEEESGSEASASELTALIQTVREHSLPAIFTERNGSPSAAGIIAAETGVKVYSLDMAMSGSSYFDAMYHNIDTIKEAFG